jgi:hypothetical protein
MQENLYLTFTGNFYFRILLPRREIYFLGLDKSLHIQLFQLRLSPEQSGKVEYERERMLGIANK